jgi:hypothetical protein
MPRNSQATTPGGYAWRIEPSQWNKRPIYGPGAITPEDEAALDSGLGWAFRLLDDDGNVYGPGRLLGDRDSEAGFGPLDDWGEGGWGCTAIQYWHRGRWETL